LQSVANNVPAFEFNANGSYKGLLVEPGATNLLTYSQQIDNAAWQNNLFANWSVATVTANARVAPDGTTTADRVLFDGSLKNVMQVVTVSANQIYTFSIYAIGNVGNTYSAGIYLHIAQGLDNVLVGGDSVASLRIDTLLSDTEWTRFDVSYTVPASGVNQLSVGISPLNLGIPNANIDVWGAQLETGSVATSPIVTTGSTANRVADSVTLTGASSLIGQTEGTLYVEVNISNSANATIFTLDDGDVSDYITIIKNSSLQIVVNIRRASGSPTTIITSSAVSLGTHKIALAYKNADYALYIDGVSGGTSVDATNLPTSLSRVLVSDSVTYGTFNDSTRSVALFPTRLSNAQLASLTTL